MGKMDTVFYFEDGGSMSFLKWTEAKRYVPETPFPERNIADNEPGSLPDRLRLARVLHKLDRRLNSAVTMEQCHAAEGPTTTSSRDQIHPDEQSEDDKEALLRQKFYMQADALLNMGFGEEDAQAMYSLTFDAKVTDLSNSEARLEYMATLRSFIMKWNMRIVVPDEHDLFVSVEEYTRKRLPSDLVDQTWPSDYEVSGALGTLLELELLHVDLMFLLQGFEDAIQKVIIADQQDKSCDTTLLHDAL